MTCAVSRMPIAYHDLSQSQFLPSPSYLDTNSALFEMMNPSSRSSHKSRLRHEYNNPKRFRSHVNVFLSVDEGFQSHGMEVSKNYDLHSPHVYTDMTASATIPRELNLEEYLIRHSRSPSVRSTRRDLTQIPPPVHGRRNMLLPPRPRLSSPLTPHPNVPQDGPIRRPFPKKRRRVEMPLLKRALFNYSNVENGLSEQCDSVEGLTLDESSGDSSWLFVRKPVDDWVMILKGELY